MVISGNQQFLRTINRLAVLRSVRLNAGISRVKLADKLKLTRPTIGNLVEELIADGWLKEEKLGPTGVLGRRPVALHIDDASRVIIGADINHEHVICVATTLSGEVRELSITPTHSGDAEVVLDILARQTNILCQRLNEAGYQIFAMGIGVPGPVDLANGVLRHSDSTGWHNLPVRDMLRARLNQTYTPSFPLLVQRAVGCVALYHFEFERRAEEEPLIYVHAGRAVTSAIANRYELLQGCKGLAGAIGHMVMDPAGPLCSCGKRGCANTLATLHAVETETGHPLSELHAAARAGDPAILQALRKAGHNFGTLLHNLCMQFDPARLFVGGPAFQVSQEFFSAARESFQQLHEQAGIAAQRIEIVRYDPNAVALGAASGALYTLVRPLS
ncbi:ROK family transcriptional regulator [Uliginosibacterium flavum]|uniref:ROK family transcriptional regulator n=1 Tax=Uliginosibacterium flavum TaxID=1396831 RepID=A0ABV2TLG2_9RHOO